jgi:hypothetical protein
MTSILSAYKWTPSPRNPRYHAKVTTDPLLSVKSIGPLSIPKLGPDRDYDSHKLGFQSLV